MSRTVESVASSGKPSALDSMLVVVLSVVVAGGAVPPQRDLLDGEQIGAVTRELLPSGRSIAGVADLWMLDLASLRATGAGLETFDELALSAHGRSWTQTRWLINDLEVTDPAAPGQPLVEIPLHLWDAMEHRSLWTAMPGVRWRLDPGTELPRVMVAGGGGGAIGGGTFVPEGLMDREPALRSGATPDRRALAGAREARAAAQVPLADGGVRAGVEHLEHRHTYPTLLSADGAHLFDDASRTTALVVAGARLGAVGVDGVGVWQSSARTHDGAEHRYPRDLTAARESHAFVAGVAADLRASSRLMLRGRAGLGWRDDDRRLRGDAPWAIDLEREWTWLQRPRFGERLERTRLGAGLTAALAGAAGRGASLELSADVWGAGIASRAQIPGGVVATTYLRAPTPAERAVALTVYGPTEDAREHLGGARLGLRWQPRALGVDWDLIAALDHGAAGAERVPEVAFVSPALGLSGRRRIGDSELALLVRHEPEMLTAEVAAFIDPRRPSGTVHRWLDDGDGAPDPGEAGEVMRRTGGAYHRIAGDLRRPTSSHLAVAWRSPRWGPLQISLRGTGSVLADRFTVRSTRPEGDAYRPKEITDPGGDGLGERRGPGGELSHLTVYERHPGDAGRELYVLTNAGEVDFWLGTDLVLSVVEPWWFVELGVDAWVSVGTAPFGLYADRNDPGIIDEVTADPNARINARGRYDNDRAFSGHLLAVLRPGGVLEGLSAGVAARYRDGEPMTRILVIDDLPQGPTAVMAVPRGDPVPRFTFQLTLDVRLRYTREVGNLELAGYVDVYNVLGSGTELSEVPITGANYRRSLEMLPGRAVAVGLELGWGS